MKPITIIIISLCHFAPMALGSDVSNLKDPYVDPNWVTKAYWYLTNVDPSTSQFIPYSLGIRWDKPIAPYRFKGIEYFTDEGDYYTTSPIIGEYDQFRTEGGQWRVKGAKVYFDWPKRIKITVTTEPEGDGDTWPRRQEVYAVEGEKWEAEVRATPTLTSRFVRWETKERHPEVNMWHWCHWSGIAPATNITVNLKATFYSRNQSQSPVSGMDEESDGTEAEDGSNRSYICVYVVSSPSGCATVTPECIIYSGACGGARVVQCTASRNDTWENYRFVNWTGTEDIYSQNGTSAGGTMRAVVNYPSTPGGIKTVRFTANYTLGATILTTSSPAAGGGTWPKLQDNLLVGDTYTVEAKATLFSDFVHWTRDGVIISENPLYTGTITQEDFDAGFIRLQAQFRPWSMMPLRQRVDNGFKVLTSSGVVVRDGDPKNMRLQ